MGTIEVTIQVAVRNPKLQTVFVRKAQAQYMVHHIVGVMELPEPAPNGPLSQLILVNGPVDCFDTVDKLVEKINTAMDLVAKGIS